MSEARDRGALFGGIGAIALGGLLIVMVIGNPSGMSPGVPLWVGIAAGGVFMLAGLLAVFGSRPGGSADELPMRVLVAVFVSLFAAVSMIFPPGGIFVVYFAVLCWMQVYRAIHQRVSGRDPFAGLSDGKHLGLGCLVTIALILVVVIGVAISKRAERSPEVLQPERMPGETR